MRRDAQDGQRLENEKQAQKNDERASGLVAALLTREEFPISHNFIATIIYPEPRFKIVPERGKCKRDETDENPPPVTGDFGIITYPPLRS